MKEKAATIESEQQKILINFLNKFSSGIEQRLRLIMFTLSVVMTLLAIFLHLSGIMGIDKPYFNILSIFYFTESVVFFVLFYHHILSLEKAFFWFSIVSQVLQSVRIFSLTYFQPEMYNEMIINNLIILYTLLLYVTFGLLKKAPIILSICTLITIFGVKYLQPDNPNNSIISIFGVLAVCTALGAVISQRTIHQLESEKNEYQHTEEEVLRVFNMTRMQLHTYLKMNEAMVKGEDATQTFFDMIDDQAEKNILEAAENRKLAKAMQRASLSDVFPSFTEAELAVCELVLKGKTQKEIAIILGKNENNISTVRGHIRKKLDLEPEKDLKEELLKILNV